MDAAKIPTEIKRLLKGYYYGRNNLFFYFNPNMERNGVRPTPTGVRLEFRVQRDTKRDHETRKIPSELAVSSRRVRLLQRHMTAQQKVSKSISSFRRFCCTLRTG